MPRPERARRRGRLGGRGRSGPGRRGGWTPRTTSVRMLSRSAPQSSSTGERPARARGGGAGGGGGVEWGGGAGGGRLGGGGGGGGAPTPLPPPPCFSRCSRGGRPPPVCDRRRSRARERGTARRCRSAPLAE